jgi:TorA maturation chaperone TorD
MNTDTILLFRLISRALSYPDERFIKGLQNLTGQINLEVFDVPEISLSTFFQELSHLEKLPLEFVQGEHTRLFINAYPRVICPPYESAYREGVLLGNSTHAVFEYYQKWGIEADGDNVDHVGSELEFYAFLLAMGSEEASMDASRFMDEHLLLWIPVFASDLQNGSRLGFYSEIGRLLGVVIDYQKVTQLSA